MIVMGIDQSLTSTGVAIMDHTGRVLVSAAIRPVTRGIDRLVAIRQQLEACIRDNKVEWVAMEGYSMGLRGNTVFQLGELGGVIKQAVHLLCCPLVIAAPKQVKKFASNSGNSQKDEMRLAVYKQWGFEAPSNDVVDAYVIARIGLGVAGGLEPNHQYQRDIIEDIRASMRGDSTRENKRRSKVG